MGGKDFEKLNMYFIFTRKETIRWFCLSVFKTPFSNRHMPVGEIKLSRCAGTEIIVHGSKYFLFSTLPCRWGGWVDGSVQILEMLPVWDYHPQNPLCGLLSMHLFKFCFRGGHKVSHNTSTCWTRNLAISVKILRISNKSTVS